MLMVVISLIASVAFAADNDLITVNYQLSAITDIEINEASVTLNITACADGDYTAVTDAATYDYTCNSSTSQKISAHLSTAITETGMTLELKMDKPDTGVMGSYATITSAIAASPVVVETGIAACSAAALDMTFQLSAASGATSFAETNKTCTLTVADVS